MRMIRLLLFILIGGGVTLPALSGELPEWAEDQQHYARILNPIAAKVMRWLDKEQISTGKSIALKDASLDKISEHHFRFILGNQLNGAEPSDMIITSFDFTLKNGALPYLEAVSSTVEQYPDQISLQSSSQPLAQGLLQTISSEDALIERLSYRSREAAYWWLAHLDGVTDARNQAAIVDWIDQVSIHSTADQPTLAGVEGAGGHLLRTLTLHSGKKAGQYEIRLMIDWKGRLANGKPGLARLEHILSGRLLDDGSLIIERIVENALLPDLQPWTKILC